MALVGSEKAYLSARSGIARSGASRSNYVFPLSGGVIVGGVDLTSKILYGSLHVHLEINDQPDTASFDVMLTDAATQAALVVGADVSIGLVGATEGPIFGGRILRIQTTRQPGQVASIRSVMCADYLQVLDAEYLITYDAPAQSSSLTIADLVARFANKPGGVALSTAGVPAGLPSHAALGVSNERFSTVLRRMATGFPGGGGFYVDALKVLRIWQGSSEPNQTAPTPLTLANPHVKSFAETVDGSQVRDAVIVEGARTTAPIGSPAVTIVDGSPGPWSCPVNDASILDKIASLPGREVRVGSQRLKVTYATGPWSSPAGQAQATIVSADLPYSPAPGFVFLAVADQSVFTGRPFGMTWVKVDESYLWVRNVIPGSGLLIPRSGFGSPLAAIKAGAVVTLVDSLGEGTVTDRYNRPGWESDDTGTFVEPIRAQPIDADVVMTVRSSTPPAIHEHIVQDGRYSRAGAAARGAREIDDFAAPLTSIQFETTDQNARPGRLQAYHFDEPPLAPMAGSFMILTADLTWPVWGELPRRSCYAANVEAAAIDDAWLVDKR